jgi:uncharacterized protein YjbI with pentapeptide repeats
MTMALRVAVKINLFLMIFGLALTSSPALAQDVYRSNRKGSLGTSPDASTTNKITIYVPKPGEKLPFEQILKTLRTTRDLSGCNLSGLNLAGLDLSNSNLQGADMRGTNLERANMSDVNLERADMSGANLKMVTFYQSGLTGAKFDHAILDGAIWFDHSICAQGSIGECIKLDVKQ